MSQLWRSEIEPGQPSQSPREGCQTCCFFLQVKLSDQPGMVKRTWNNWGMERETACQGHENRDPSPGSSYYVYVVPPLVTTNGIIANRAGTASLMPHLPAQFWRQD